MWGYVLSLVGAVPSQANLAEPLLFLSCLGGFTVLATKALSTLLTLEWWDMFTERITYPVILVS